MKEIMKILVVVASKNGHTQELAEAFAQGAREEGGTVKLSVASDVNFDDLIACDALILASGVHMGGIESPMSDFFERTASLWLSGRLMGKMGAALVSAGLGTRGGGELALLTLHSFLAEHGSVLVSMPRKLSGFNIAGSHWGPIAETGAHLAGGTTLEARMEAARAHGGHVAACTRRWLRGARTE